MVCPQVKRTLHSTNEECGRWNGTIGATNYRGTPYTGTPKSDRLGSAWYACRKGWRSNDRLCTLYRYSSDPKLKNDRCNGVLLLYTMNGPFLYIIYILYIKYILYYIHIISWNGAFRNLTILTLPPQTTTINNNNNHQHHSTHHRPITSIPTLEEPVLPLLLPLLQTGRTLYRWKKHYHPIIIITAIIHHQHCIITRVILLLLLLPPLPPQHHP